MRLLALRAAPVALLLATPASGAEQPRLVVQITFDQLRGDLLERYRPVLTGGLKRVLDHGWWVQHGEAAHGITVSWPGHATLATGLYPSHHGWTANEWWMDVGGRWQEVDVATDKRSQELGRDNRPGKSSASLQASSIGDWFKASDPASKVVAIGSDAAVPYGGRAPDGLFWFDGAAGGFTTSTNYSSALPDWITRLNAKIGALPQSWTYSGDARWLSLAQHPQQCPAFGPRTGFPHNYVPGENGRSIHAWIGSTPLADEELINEAGEIVRANGLGADNIPDYLAISVGSTDSVGHEYGPVSPEQLDTLIRLDRALGHFLDDLDLTVGAGRYVVAISADHGATDPPEQNCIHRVTSAEIDALLDRIERIARAHRGSRRSLISAIVAELRRVPFIGGVYTKEGLDRASASDWKAQLMKRSFRPGHIPNFPLWSDKPRPYHPARYGIWVTFKEGMIFDAAESVHGSPYAADRWVPVIFYGASVPQRTLDRGARTVDVAPTLAALAGVPAPSHLDGRSLLPRAGGTKEKSR
jgi:predicted AlkP superfamily pyrophosphatase or phosphodiesterase